MELFNTPARLRSESGGICIYIANEEDLLIISSESSHTFSII